MGATTHILVIRSTADYLSHTQPAWYHQFFEVAKAGRNFEDKSCSSGDWVYSESLFVGLGLAHSDPRIAETEAKAQ